jgi:serine protease AprX
LTVGAVNDRGTVRESDDQIAAFSSRGPAIGGLTKPDLIAPGVNIISLRADGSLLDRSLPRNRVGTRYFRLSGTSFSAPLTAGTAALLLQKQPGLSPLQVKSLLKRNAFSRNLPANTQGAGELNVRFAAASKAAKARTAALRHK